MSDRNFMGLIGVIILAIVGSIFIFGGSASGSEFIGDPLEIATGEATGETDDEGNPVPVQRADHLIGTGDASVRFIEYGDFGCPACGGFYPELKQIEQTFGDQIDVIFRHNPLTTLHPNAFAAHRASVAADNQEKFWEMHDLLYERRVTWAARESGLSIEAAAAVFVEYAEELELDVDKFKEDVASQETFNFIDSHLDSGEKLDVTGTPTIFINGEVVQLRTAAEITQYINGLLADETGTTGGVDAIKPEEEAASSDEEN